MFELQAFATPNSLKPVIALEEMGLDYELHCLDIRKGEQRSDAFKAMNPNGKVPVLTDRDPVVGPHIVLSESAAILVYLAEKSGQFLSEEPLARAKVFEQLFFHASGVSPAFLQAFLVAIQKEPAAEAKERAAKEVDRVLGVLDMLLSANRYVAGEDYSIADIAHFGWLWRHAFIGADFSEFPHVARWYADVLARPAVATAIVKTTALAG